MSTHIVLTAILCAATCQPVEVRVWDGDTAWIAGTKVRMAGYDTPERGSRARCPAEAAAAEKARERLAAILRDADAVRVERLGRKSYDRELVRVTVDGRPLAEMMIGAGLATERMATRSTWCRGDL